MGRFGVICGVKIVVRVDLDGFGSWGVVRLKEGSWVEVVGCGDDDDDEDDDDEITGGCL